MKKLMLAASLLATLSAPVLADTVMIDGCEAKLVEGTNYYNFVNPRCVTATAAGASTTADGNRAGQPFVKPDDEEA
jgi:opacity protein-like surface antigen